jgi:hypothetical protein
MLQESVAKRKHGGGAETEGQSFQLDPSLQFIHLAHVASEQAGEP